jgi:hypothetical protein
VGGTVEGRPFEATATRPSRCARLREAYFEDYQQIALLESRYGLKVKGCDEWRHLWRGNPMYREVRSDWPIGWVIEDENRQIVGSIGNIPLAYKFEGKRILAASGRAQVAESRYRSASLLLLDRLINQPGVDLYLNSTMSRDAAASFSMFDCPRVPVGVWDESAFWITGYQGFAQSLLIKKNCPLPKPLSYPLSLAVFLKDAVAAKALCPGDVEVHTCAGFDDRFDDFWSALESRYPHLLLAVRTRACLEWHFRYALEQQRLWIAAVVDGPRLAAYGLFLKKETLLSGLKRVQLVDFQSLDGSTALLLPILHWAFRKCRKESIHMLESVGRWLEDGEAVRSLAPHRRKLPSWSFFYRSNNPSLALRLRSPRAWAPSLFDGDASL